MTEIEPEPDVETSTPTTGKPAMPADLNVFIDALPQEKPFLFVDEILELDTGKKAVGAVTFAPDHPVFDGHLPNDPIVPGVILIEALAQMSGLVMVGPGHPSVYGYLAEARRVRFRRLVRPQERVVLSSTLERKFGSTAFFTVEATIEGELTAGGSITVGGMR